MHERILIVKFLIVLIQTHSLCVDFTPSDPACDTMIPTLNSNSIESSSNATYRIRIYDRNFMETFEYSMEPDNNLYVKIDGGKFERAHIQARSVLHPTIQVGQFLQPTSEYFKIVNCGGINGGAIINDHHVSRHHEKLEWQPPRIPIGPIIFLASVIQSKRLVHIRSSFLSLYQPKIQLDNRGCGHSYNCFKIGSDSCIFGESCLFSLKWRCHKRHLILEGLQNGRLVSFGFAVNDQHAVLCVAAERSIRINEFSIEGDNIFSTTKKQSRNRGLKVIREKGRVYCRFEMERPSHGKAVFIYGRVNRYGQPDKVHRWELPGHSLCDANELISRIVPRNQPKSQSSSAITMIRSAFVKFCILYLLYAELLA